MNREELRVIGQRAVEGLRPEDTVKYFLELCETGLSREQIYIVARMILFRQCGEVSDEVATEIGEFLSGLTGECQSDYIVKIKADPPGLVGDDFVRHVRGNQWSSNTPEWPSID